MILATIKLDNLAPVRAGEKWVAWGLGGAVRIATSIWDRMASCIREVAREVLGVSRGISSRQQGDLW